MSIETPDGVLDVTNATLRVPQIEVQGTSVTTSLSTLSNVGVGTASPGGRLHVYGPDAKTLLQSTSNTANVEIGGPSGAIVDLKGPFTDDYDLRIQSSSDGGNLATTGNANHIRLASTSGYTGFGTSTPQYKIDVQGVKGIDAVSNPSAHNPVFLYDDQESTTTFSGTVGGTGSSRNTTSKYLELNSLADNVTGYVYWPIQMPNSWSAEFDHYVGGGDGGESLSFSFFNTSAPTTTGNHGGYRLAIAEFYGGAPAAKVVLYYQGSELAQKDIAGGIPTASWNKVVVNYNRGSISLSLNGRSVFSYEATENADSYTGRYAGFIGKTGLRDNYHRVRNVKCTSGTNWVYATGSNATTLAYLSGNVGIGTDVTTERLEISGNVKATHFVGDGGLLSNIATTLDSIVNQGNTTSNTVQFTNSNVAIFATGNIVADTGAYFVGDGSKLVNIPTDFESIIVNGNTTSNVVYFANTDVAIQASGNIVVDSDSFFIGNGGLLSNIATTLEDISNQGNTTSNTIQFTNSDVGFITTANVGIANSAPTNNLSIGSNVHVDDTGSNVLTVYGNVTANVLTLGAFGVVAAYGLNQVTAENNTTSENIILTNAKTGLTVSSNIDVAGQLNLSNVTTCIDASSNIELGGRLRFDSNVFVDTLRVADLAANLVTYDQSTGELLDSGGLFLNKISVVSEQPPSALTANTTTVADHGNYILTTSGLETGSNTWNAFDDNTSIAWTSRNDTYIGASNIYDENGTTQLSAVSSTQNGEWLAIELPYKTKLRHMKLTPQSVEAYPNKANLYATNDSLSWTELTNWNGVTPSSASDVQTVKVNATTAYKKYAIVTTKVAGNSSNVALGEIRLFAESFAIDGGKIEMATSAVTGGETVMDQTTGHGREPAVLKKYPEVVFAEGKFDYNDSTNTYTQGGYTVSSSTAYAPMSYPAWKVHTGVKSGSDFWHSQLLGYIGTSNTYTGSSTLAGISGEWVKTQFPTRVKVTEAFITVRTGYGGFDFQSPSTFYIVGSSDDTNWTTLATVIDRQYETHDVTARVTLSTTGYYRYYAIVVSKVAGDRDVVSIDEIEYYGYEETNTIGDTSLDTTITSKYNTPDLTSASLYLDGLKGSTATDYSGNDVAVTENNVTWDSTEKSWELTGAATSNIVTADLGFEGDQPHSISAWVKADQLNGDGLFHLGTAEGEGDAASRVGFVDDSHISWGGEDHYFSNAEWHNVTYTYNGEGSDKKLYLDGRLVGTAKNEDTFGDYPPFAMTTYSEYGYTVSASSEYSSTYQAWEAFDKINSSLSSLSYWSSQGQNYSNGIWNGGTQDPTRTTNVEGVNKYGEWLQIEFPHTIMYNYSTILAPYDHEERLPRDGYIVGSNDLSGPWTTLHRFEDMTRSTTTETVSYIPPSNPTRAFKYFRIVIENITGGGGNFAGIDQWNIFGHRENDLVRFPDPTNVLKYPHVAMTGPAQRGYVATMSSPQSYIYEAWKSFDNNSSTWSEHAYNSVAYAASGATNGNQATTNNIDGSGTYEGEWIQIQFPRKVTISRYELTNRNNVGYRMPKTAKLIGSNDGSNWTTVYNHSDSGGAYTSSGQETRNFDVSSTTGYKYFRLITNELFPGVSNDTPNIATWNLYGTEPEDVVARVGDGYDGKVRNLRVFSTALSQDRVQEIFDADKDEFGLAKSSVSVYRGHLGIGTTEPKAALTIMDEVGELEEFPPRAMTAAETYMDGHGVFKASASSDDTTHFVFNAFNKKFELNEGWISASAFTTTTGYADSSSINNVSYFGAPATYISIQMPYKISLQKIKLQPHLGGSGDPLKRPLSAPKDFDIWARSGKGLWQKLVNYTDAVFYQLDGYKEFYEVNSSDFFDEFALVIRRTHSNSSYSWTSGTSTSDLAMVGEWRLFGTREQGASTLHNGELTLTRNLTVPRIGPALDADDTPRRDRLVVEYNTSTNPTENGVVKDTSGRGLDGRMVGVTYDATEKALVFDGTDDYINTGKLGFTGSDRSISVSYWIKARNGTDGLSAGQEYGIFHVGSSGSGLGVSVFNDYGGSDSIWIWIPGNYSYYVYTLAPVQFYHMTIVYGGGGIGGDNVHLYINGVEQTRTGTGGTTTATPTFNESGELRIGDWFDGSAPYYRWPGSISNFKFYDVALTADEVKRLYEMGRCDEGHHTTVVSRSKLQMRGEQLIIEPCIRGFYEEGTWTPIIYGTTGGEKTPTSINGGWFVRVGNLVTIGGTLSWNGGTTITGQVRIKTLPYTIPAGTNNRAALSFGVAAGSSFTTPTGTLLRMVIDPGSDFIYLIASYESGTSNYEHVFTVGASGNLYGFSGSYLI